jgi:phosphoglycolate phosphatase-like HAD superfamily hydrolase
MAAIGCSWGYRGRAALEQAGADVVVDEAQELLQILVQKSN